MIDWDCAGIGDPLMDVAGTAFWSHHLVCMQQQAADFDAHLSHWPGYRDRLLCYQLRIGLEELHEAGDDAGSAATRDGVFRQLRQLLDA